MLSCGTLSRHTFDNSKRSKGPNEPPWRQHEGKWYLPKVDTPLECHLDQVAFLDALLEGAICPHVVSRVGGRLPLSDLFVDYRDVPLPRFPLRKLDFPPSIPRSHSGCCPHCPNRDACSSARDPRRAGRCRRVTQGCSRRLARGCRRWRCACERRGQLRHSRGQLQRDERRDHVAAHAGQGAPCPPFDVASPSPIVLHHTRHLLREQDESSVFGWWWIWC